MFKKSKQYKVGYRDAMSHDKTSWNLEPIKNKAPLAKILLRVVIWAAICFGLYMVFKPYN